VNYISAEKLQVRFGERELFSNLNIGISKGEKIALVAGNGSGKSTLLSILAKKIQPDLGSVSHNAGIRVGFLEQEPNFEDALSIEQQIEKANTRVSAAIHAYQAAIKLQEQRDSRADSMLSDAMAVMDELGAWDYERRLTELLTKFRINDLSQKIGSLSGGQKKRLSLALTLLEEPDALLLDEPTNHLDIDMIEWLEGYLSKANATLIMVTHDRYFLDSVCNAIFELHAGKLFRHQGNYAYFLEKKSERLDNEGVTREKEGQFLKRELEWMRRSPKARTTKSKSRIQRFDDRKEGISGYRRDQEIEFAVKQQRIGGKVLEMKKVSKSFENLPILKGFDYTFKKGERIGIVGPNGSGKSTFLNLIMGLLEPDGGKINRGDTMSFGYFRQDGLKIEEEKRVIDVVKEVAEVIELANGSKVSAAQFLRNFDFDDHKQYTLSSNLSGGERRRLHLIMVLIKNPNFLILDEPTNDLDLLTLNKLEDFLTGYQGCLLLVSHDRYFLDKLVDHIFIFEGSAQIKDYNGSYSEWREEQLEQLKSNQTQEVVEKEAIARVQQRSAKMSFKEKHELETIESEIEALEARKEELELKMTEVIDDYPTLQVMAEELQKILVSIDQKTNRWMELEEIRDAAENA
jgi:ATP-binding cassette subfamily F protein uup